MPKVGSNPAMLLIAVVLWLVMLWAADYWLLEPRQCEEGVTTMVEGKGFVQVMVAGFLSVVWTIACSSVATGLPT